MLNDSQMQEWGQVREQHAVSVLNHRTGESGSVTPTKKGKFFDFGSKSPELPRTPRANVYQNTYITNNFNNFSATEIEPLQLVDLDKKYAAKKPVISFGSNLADLVKNADTAAAQTKLREASA